MQAETVKIGNYLVSADREIFRIFPKAADGTTRPITRNNQFLYLRCAITGTLVVMKRYLHQKQWFWRDSRDAKHSDEGHILSEVARMLFGGEQYKAQEVLLAAIMGLPIPHGEPVAG